MKLNRLLLLLAISTGILHSVSIAFAQELRTNYFAAINREIDLVRSIFAEPNKTFDTKLCASLQIEPKSSVEIRYLQIAFFIFYPNTNDVGPSFCRMESPYPLLHERDRITRMANPTNEIPINYIRVFDPSKSQVTADLRVFVAVAQPEHPETVRYLHRSFQFIYRQRWKDLQEPTPKR